MSFSQLPTVTIHGRLTADPELRFTPSGAAVANFTVASSERRKQGDEWVDGDKCFLRCAVWKQAAENVAESLQRGDQVVVVGKLFQREYDDREGNKRTTFEVKVDSISAEIDRKALKVSRADRGSEGQRSQQQHDPWSTGAGSGFTEEPPF